MATGSTKETISTRSGYEIREGLLGLAHDIVAENMHVRLETVPDGDKSNFEGYTTQDVIKTAEELYKFVQQK